jgi:Na+-driven multidrug efflux pump
MRLPSVALICIGLIQIAVGGTLGLGLFGVPQFGMRGVAAGQLVAFALGTIFLAWYLISGLSRLELNFSAFSFQRGMFLDILKVGAVACLSPLQTVLTILIFTRIVATFGTETLAGYGIGARLEFLLIPISFAFGIASVPMVGMAIGAGLVKRARQVAWTAAAAAGLIVGLIGAVVAIRPALWVSLFTRDVGVSAAACSYFALAGPAFVFFGLGVSLYFSSQGAARVGGPVLASTARLLMVATGGWWLASTSAPAWALFALVGAAMVVFGLATAGSVALTRWGEQARIDPGSAVRRIA